MTSRIIEGDCIEAMAGMPAASVDAVVCDPPYGLEFMGKAWDRLGDVGQASHTGPVDDPRPNVFGRSGAIAYSATSNRRCGRCGHWEYSGTPCECGSEAIWPNVRAHQGRLMQEWHEAWAREALRVLKPGGHLLAFSGTRTSHRLVCAVEDAGFEIRDSLVWLYGSGFPKSLDVGKQIDKAAGVERERGSGTATACPDFPEPCEGHPSANGSLGGGVMRHALPTLPATPNAEQWDGWGTALKPGHEPVCLARKPLTGTVAATVLEFGTGALNVDGCRINPGAAVPGGGGLGAAGSMLSRAAHVEAGYRPAGESYPAAKSVEAHTTGRWPANVLLSHTENCEPECAPECPVRMLDEQTGDVRSAGEYRRGPSTTEASPAYGAQVSREGFTSGMYADSGGPSRFFPSFEHREEPRFRYVAKASSVERSAGLDGKLDVCRCHAANTEASPPRDTDEPTGADDLRWSTSGSGSKPTDDLSPTAIRSTTETSTSRTTPSTTSNSSPQPTTSASTPLTTDATTLVSGSDGAASAANGSSPPPSTTTSAAKAGPSTADADPAISAESSRQSSSALCADCGGVVPGAWKNTHPLEPTVKPIELMRWLVRLITPPGGTVLDPFAGSGTTGCAAALEGFDFIGIEREPEYAEIARARIAWWEQHPEGMELVKRLEAEQTRKATADSGQLDMFGGEAA